MLRSGSGAHHWQEDLPGALRRMAYVEQSKRLVFGNSPQYDALAFNKHFVVQAVDVFVSAGRDKAATFSDPCVTRGERVKDPERKL
jgi:hypothetical protein